MHIQFLGLEEVLEIHRDQIRRYGGDPGMRDLGLLRSAIAMPQAGVSGQYFHADLFEMAATYLFHIVKNHAFVDGNKRVGAMTAFVFLSLNFLTVTASNRTFERVVLSTAEGKLDKAGIARFFRENTRPRRA